MISIKEIGYDKLDILLRMYREKAEWLNSIGQPMWNLEFLEREVFLRKYENPECFLAYKGNIPIGGFILVSRDDFLWGLDSHKGAYYLHKLVIKKGYNGKGYAHKMIKWAEKYSKNKGKEKIRLDCYADRRYLTKLYTECGFNLVNIKTMSDGTRIAQFEKIFISNFEWRKIK